MSTGVACELPPLRFLVLGRPQPKERARMGWAWRRARRIWYTPTATREYADKVAVTALIARADWEQWAGLRWPQDATYALSLRFRPRGRRRYDLDNVLKNVKDALQGVLWDNDRLVAEVHLLTTPAGGDAMPQEEALEVTVQAAVLQAPASPRAVRQRGDTRSDREGGG